MILDTSGLLAAFVADQRHHAECAAALASDSVRVVSPYVLAELDHLALTRRGVSAELTILSDLASGAYELAAFDAGDLLLACQIIERHRDLEVGLADASLAVLAHRHNDRRILTLDQRHFRPMVGIDGSPFELVPFDT
jgi:hypothetical protein